jgi:predicted nucleotidyltransferase
VKTITGGSTEGRDSYLAALQAKLQADSHIRAAWLEGSLGRGSADRYSDIDLHLFLKDTAQPAFSQNIGDWLSEVRPLVLCTLMFGGHMVNALTNDGLRIDLWPHVEEASEIDALSTLVLHETPGSLIRAVAPVPDPVVLGQRVLGLIQEFWRCISLLPAVLGRNETLVAVQGLSTELGLITELLIAGSETRRDRGVRNLNAYLPPETRRRLEHTAALPNLSLQALADAHLSLATLVHIEGPALAERFSFAYPEALEETVTTCVQAELQLLGLRVGPLN